MLPCGHGVSPSGEVGTPTRRELALRARSSTPDRRLGCLRGVRSALRRGAIGFFCPAGTGFRPPAKLGRLRGVRFRLCGAHFASPAGAIGFFCPAGTEFRPPAEIGTPARRAARWGRLWGYAPFSAPLASPPKHPLRAFSISAGLRGHASYAAGASLTRCARSGDLPPRRVNAIFRFRFGQCPLQPNPMMVLVP